MIFFDKHGISTAIKELGNHNKIIIHQHLLKQKPLNTFPCEETLNIMLTKYFISVALLCMLLCVSIDAELFEDTIAIEEGAKAEDVTPFKSIFFPVGTNDCRLCRPPCSGFICCDGKWPSCCVVNGRCRCCG